MNVLESLVTVTVVDVKLEGSDSSKLLDREDPVMNGGERTGKAIIASKQERKISKAEVDEIGLPLESIQKRVSRGRQSPITAISLPLPERSERHQSREDGSRSVKGNGVKVKVDDVGSQWKAKVEEALSQRVRVDHDLGSNGGRQWH